MFLDKHYLLIVMGLFLPIFSDEIAELEHRRRTGSASRSSGPVRYVRHISHDTEMRTDQAAVPRRRSSRSRDSP